MTLHSVKPVDLIDGNEIDVVTVERLERRLTEECGAIRLDISGMRTDMANMRAELIDRSADQTKWLLGFFIAQTAALAALLALFR
jgi:hypothetical protein